MKVPARRGGVRGPESGFSLIEALMASAVLSLSALTLFGALFKSFVLASQFGLVNDAGSVFSRVEGNLRRLERESGFSDRFETSGTEEENDRRFSYTTEVRVSDEDLKRSEVEITIHSEGESTRHFSRRIYLDSI